MTTSIPRRDRQITPLPHEYETRLIDGAGGYATVSAAGLPELLLAPPTTFGGPGDAWTPEHLLLASVQSCFLFTFRAIARFSHLEFVHLEVDASGIVDRDDVTRFTDIVLRPRLRVPAGTDRQQVQHVLERTEHQCLISATLATPTRIEPEIVEV